MNKPFFFCHDAEVGIPVSTQDPLHLARPSTRPSCTDAVTQLEGVFGLIRNGQAIVVGNSHENTRASTLQLSMVIAHWSKLELNWKQLMRFSSIDRWCLLFEFSIASRWTSRLNFWKLQIPTSWTQAHSEHFDQTNRQMADVYSLDVMSTTPLAALALCHSCWCNKVRSTF